MTEVIVVVDEGVPFSIGVTDVMLSSLPPSDCVSAVTSSRLGGDAMCTCVSFALALRSFSSSNCKQYVRNDREIPILIVGVLVELVCLLSRSAADSVLCIHVYSDDTIVCKWFVKSSWVFVIVEC